MAVEILVVTAASTAAAAAAAAADAVNHTPLRLLLYGLASLRLAPLQNRQKRRRLDAAVVGSLVGVPKAEERDGDGSRAAEGGLAVEEVGDAAGGVVGGRGGLRGGDGARAGAGVVAVGAEAAEAVAEAGGADAAAPPLRGVFRAFPDLFFLDVHRHGSAASQLIDILYVGFVCVGWKSSFFQFCLRTEV